MKCIWQSYDIPYRVYGGLSFFQRAEVKDIVAYPRLCKKLRGRRGVFARDQHSPPWHRRHVRRRAAGVCQRAHAAAGTPSCN
ncbi:MAG: hypothetical protein R2881_06300 [Eubacteriales bacterium]